MTEPKSEDVLASLRTTCRIVVDLVRSAATPRLKVRPRPGAWSIHEHACHLAVVQPVMMQRLELTVARESPHIHGYQPSRDEDPDALLKMDLAPTLDRYLAERAAMVARLEQLTEAEWHKPATHDEYAAYSIAIMTRHLALHDYFHAYRIEHLILERH
ncbi:MAG: DinB family protein [Candidatus Hydrogenedentes bacterium]|nr:DinB family protein [Candidatus Hydrogenedentota bacterium]